MNYVLYTGLLLYWYYVKVAGQHFEYRFTLYQLCSCLMEYSYPFQVSLASSLQGSKHEFEPPPPHSAAEPRPLWFFSVMVESHPAEAPPLQRLQHVGEGPQLQHRLGRHAAQQIEGRTLDAGNV